MAEQLASVPEESSTDFTALSPRCYSYRESFLSGAGPNWRIRSTLSSQSGQRGSSHSSISGAGGASSSYLFNTSGSSSAGAADFGADELHHKVGSSLSASEDSTTGSTAPHPPCDSYRESIRSVAWPEWSIRSTHPSLSSGSSASSSYFSNNSGYSSGLGSAGATDFRASELTKIAHRMVSDGYTQRMVQAFGDGDGGGGGPDRALQNWFVELDVDWVVETRGDNGLRGHLELLLQNTSASSHRELIEKWVRALTLIVASIKKELVAAAYHDTSAVARFGKASISAMLVFVEAILDVFKAENLHPVLHMYVCVSSASYDMSTMQGFISSEARSIFSEIVGSLVREASRLIRAISTPMKEMIRVTINNDDDWWALEILRGGGEVHKNTRWVVDYIVSMRKVQVSTQNTAQSDDRETLRGLIQDTIDYLNDLLWKNSEMFPDPSLRYMFLLNNSYHVAQASASLDVGMWAGQRQRLELTGKCAEYMESFMSASWEDLLSKCPLCFYERQYRETSSLARFQSAFHKTYRAQKFWKVPDPRLRSLLRETITDRVISGYRHYLSGAPYLEEQFSSGRNNPEVMKQMLGDLFEG